MLLSQTGRPLYLSQMHCEELATCLHSCMQQRSRERQREKERSSRQKRERQCKTKPCFAKAQQAPDIETQPTVTAAGAAAVRTGSACIGCQL